MARTAVITGTTSGIGEQLQERLSAGGWNIVTVNRRSLPSTPGVRRVVADLSEPKQVRAAGAEIAGTGEPVDLLINNAGVLLGGHAYNAAGLELHYAVNTLAPVVLLSALRPALAAAGTATAVTVSSSALYQAGPLDIDKLVHPTRFRRLFGAYAQSKLAVSVAMAGLAASYEPDGIVLRTVEPGSVKTVMTSGPGMPKALLPIRNLFFTTPQKAVDAVLAATDPALGRRTGVFVLHGKVKPLPAKVTPARVQALLDRLDTDAR